MLYNDDKFGQLTNVFARSPYTRSTQDSPPIPPPGYYYLVDNDGFYLIDNDGKYLLQYNV